MASCVLLTSNEVVKMLVQLPWDCFNPQKRFIQLAYHILFSCSLEPHRLTHKDLLIKIVMEKDGLHIELIKLQSYCVTNTNNIRIDECFT